MFEKRIKRGVAYLDKRFGRGWVFDIDLDTFSMGSPCRCVIGQVNSENYFAYCRNVGWMKNNRLTPKSLGFDLGTNVRATMYGSLTCQWKKEIVRLRKERFRHEI